MFDYKYIYNDKYLNEELQKFWERSGCDIQIIIIERFLNYRQQS
jgi:hypothetical protein